MFSALKNLVMRDILCSVRQLHKLFQPALFFIVTVSLFPLAIGPDPEFLRQIVPGVIWVTALLATLLAVDGVFKSEYDDGTLDLLVLSPYPLAMMALAKVIAHWLLTGLPIVIMSSILAPMLNLPLHALGALWASLLLGTLSLSIIGTIGAALTLSLRQSGILLTLIIMPLFVPVLIFGTSAIKSGILQLDWSAQIYLLAAYLVISITLAPFAIAAALKISLN